MSADVQEQALQVTLRTTEVSLKIMLNAVREILKDNNNEIVHGQQSLKSLNLQNKQLENVTLPAAEFNEFKKELKKYAVDFSVKKDKENDKIIVFFKGQDVDRVNFGLEKCLKAFEEKGLKKPLRERMQEAVWKAQQKNKERQEKNKDISKTRKLDIEH